jgi:hypothetical protein
MYLYECVIYVSMSYATLWSEPACIRPNSVRGEKDSLLDNTVENRGRFLVLFIVDELCCSSSRPGDCRRPRGVSAIEVHTCKMPRSEESQLARKG